MRISAFALIVAACLLTPAALADSPLPTRPASLFPSPSAAPADVSSFVSGTCATTNAVAVFSAAQTLTCFSTFTWNGTTLTMPATWSLPADTTVALGGGVNGINFDSNTLSIDATNNRIGIGTAAPTAIMHLVTAGSGGTRPVFESTTSDGFAGIWFQSDAGAVMNFVMCGSACGASDYMTGIPGGAPFNNAAFFQARTGTSSFGIMTNNVIPINFGTNNIASFFIDSSTQALTMTSKQVLLATGTGNGIGFVGDADTQIVSTASDTITFKTANTGRIVLTTTAAAYAVPITNALAQTVVDPTANDARFWCKSGTTTAPCLSGAGTAGSENTGINIATTTDQIDFVLNGTERWNWTSAGNMLPKTDNDVDIGSDALRVKLVRAVTVTTGDLVMDGHDQGGARWRLVEADDRIIVVNEDTGERFHMMMEAE